MSGSESDSDSLSDDSGFEESTEETKQGEVSFILGSKGGAGGVSLGEVFCFFCLPAAFQSTSQPALFVRRPSAYAHTFPACRVMP